MRSISWRRALFLSLVISTVAHSRGEAAIPGFPENGLAERIAFWEKVFTTYGADDLIIHDAERVNLVYDVVDERSRRSGVRRIQALLDEVRVGVDSPEELGAEARRIHDLIEAAGVTMTAGNIAVLRNRVHVQRGVMERFRDGVIRSGRYLDYFQSVLESEDVPGIISLLPLVESSFQNVALSSAGAAGIWQFTRSTGRQFMRVTRGRDERLDPVVSTRAAARLLRGNYEALQSWPLAISAYNHGRSGMLRAQRAHGSDMATIIANYESRTFGYASKNFYAEFIAAVNVYQNYPSYFGPLALDQPQDFSAATARIASNERALEDGVPYRVRPGDTLSLIAVRNGTSVRDLIALNNLTGDRIYAGETLILARDRTPRTATDGEYEVRRGDTLSEIAREFGLEIRELMESNELSNSRIYAGQVLILP